MTSTPLALRRNLGYVGTHASLLAGAVGLLFLQRYLWLLKIAEQGYGPYQTVSYLAGLSSVMILIDLAILWWALKGPQTNMAISLLWPAFFFGSALWVILGNNA
jgi:nitrogen fixation-related uncharacterized protein